MNKKYILLLYAFIASQLINGQEYSSYKSKIDTSFISSYLGYEKNISITLPEDWQKNSKKEYPLIIIFDRQNKRSHNHIINTIDYLTVNNQMPLSIVISIESDRFKRINEARSPISDKNGKSDLTEKYLFQELIPYAESKLRASKFRILIGHSWYGHFTTSMFSENNSELNAVISLDPFFKQNNVSLTDSITKLSLSKLRYHKYYRYAIGKDYPDDIINIKDVQKENLNQKLNINGKVFPLAFHNAVPGLGIGEALYDIFEYWQIQQLQFFNQTNKRVDIFSQLEQNILNHYGSNLNFSLATLNGKASGLYYEKEYVKAIKVWEKSLEQYPHFSESYLYIIDAKQQLEMDTSLIEKKFKESLSLSSYYSESEKKELLSELKK